LSIGWEGFRRFRGSASANYAWAQEPNQAGIERRWRSIEKAAPKERPCRYQSEINGQTPRRLAGAFTLQDHRHGSQKNAAVLTEPGLLDVLAIQFDLAANRFEAIVITVDDLGQAGDESLIWNLPS